MSLMPIRERYIGDEDALLIWWFKNGSLINLTSGYTYTLKLSPWSDKTDVLFTKTTGFAGATGSGTEQDAAGVPNLVVSFATSGELNTNTITEGPYYLEIVAKDGTNAETTYQMRLNMKTRLG